VKTLITALAFAIVIVAPGLTEPADARGAARKTEPAAGTLGRDSFPSQNEKCYWRGQCYIIDDENTRCFTIEASGATSNVCFPRLTSTSMSYSLPRSG
jgi:hypothetical protein